MPFQVTFSQRLLQVNAIQSVSAGPDASAVCDISFVLTATVVGELTGHALLWEQISGTPVTFDSPVDQLSVSYTQNNFDDKTFRFYVDKGTSFQKYDDVTIFGSPTTSQLNSASTGTLFSATTTESIYGEDISLEMLSPFPLTDYSNMVEYTSVLDPILTWNIPETIGIVTGSLVQVMDALGAWTTIAALPPEDTMYKITDTSKRYRIRMLIMFSSLQHIDSNAIWVPSAHVNIHAVDQATAFTSISSNLTSTYNYDINVITLISKDVVDIADSHGSTQVANPYNYDVTKVILTILLPPVDSNRAQASISATPIINDYDVTVSSGGQVGG